MRLRHLLAFTLFAACGPGTTPDAGIPVAQVCPEGTEGCACTTGDRCGANGRGEQLLCQGAVCQAMTCPAGEPGCVCRNGSLCNDAASACTEGFCVAAGCVPGQANCTCLAGSCDSGLTCLSGAVCVDSTGYEGGACLATGRCTRGNRCDPATGLCVFCEPGGAGCACNGNNACNAGLACTAGLCLSASQVPPANPKCFTGCRADLVGADGGTLTCGPDDVLPGCLPGKSCVQGSCVEPGQPKPTCAGDLDCPPFQVCLTGGCYSNCDVNADCGSGLGCFRHACRPTCVSGQGQAACPGGTTCTANDGQNGFCTPVGSSSGAATANPRGGLEVPQARLELSNVNPAGSFMLVPKTGDPQDIVVRKLWHSSTNAAGVTERVDAPADGHGAFRTCDPVRNECPLSWLSLKAPGTTVAQQAPTISFRLLPGCVDPASGAPGTACPLVGVEGAGNTTAVKWEGELEVSSRDALVRVRLSYVQRPDGQWSGSMFYFGTFSNTGLAAWIDSPTKSNVANVNNGLLQRWGALRVGGLPGGWQEFLAVLTATREGSWTYANVKQRCAGLGVSTAACYPFTNTAGVRTYVQNPVQNPIPTGVTELPVALNLKINGTQADLFEGRMVSSRAMHYPGNPGVKLQFTGNPALMTSCSAAGGADCLVFLKDIKAVAADVNQLVSAVGGRYLSSDGTCGPGYTPVEVPWLIPGFADGTRPATSGGGLSRVECRDAELPFDVAVAASNGAVNKSLAGANPVPDGQPRVRTLRFLDGVLVNQTELFALFEETYTSFIPGRLPTTAYGYLKLSRAPAQLGPADYDGLRGPASTVKTPPVPAGAQCDAQLMAELGTSMANKRDLVAKMLDGSRALSSGYAPVVNQGAAIHYHCEDTGFFNGGPGDDGTPGAVKQACPRGSKVTFFNVCNVAGTSCSRTALDLSREACQTQLVEESTTGGAACERDNDCTSGDCQSGRCRLECNGPEDCRSGLCDDHVCKRATCRATLAAWKANPASNTVAEGGSDTEPLVSACVAANEVYCDDDRLDLRAGKTFFRKQASTGKNFLELQQLIDLAFRYKTRFRSSTSGSSVGFAPERCVPNSDAVPYCYDPQQIEEARKRVDCLVDVYSDTGFINSLDTTAPDLALRARLFGFLKQNFSQVSQVRDGFERLNAELLTMLGDEALTAAYASRFDIAAAGGANFRGTAFEAGGIDLSGVAGAEMFNLYQSVQYYQLALDRLYRFGPNMQAALSRNNAVGSDPNFISPETVTSYLERLVRAASQKSRAWGEIARRYQNFNRPDLARRVIERAYLGTYLESALISRLMLDITEQSASATLPQLRLTLDKVQRNYRMALLDMRTVYAQLTDETNFFGYAPDYVPFPALDGTSVGSSNAYEVVSLLAKQRLDLARTREQTALTFGKQGKVDAVQFQADLTSIRNTYENQLASICGTFVADNGSVYPAIQKYAPEGTLATLMGDPCGRAGNGEINNAVVAMKDAALKLQGVQIRQDNLYREIAIERERVAQQCNLTEALARYQFTRSGMAADLQHEIDNGRAATAAITGTAAGVIAVANGMKCEDTGCVLAAAQAVTIGLASAVSVGAQLASDLVIAEKERELKDFDRKSVRFATQNQCAVAQVDSTARIANLFNDTLETEIEALRGEYGIRLALADVRKLLNSAQRLQAQQQEAESLAIDVQAAQNDPNVRIYQNDSVINADVSFNSALATAYRLTRVYEYYTSQSYAKKEQLFLIRMVTAGQYNLENYLLELDNEFQTFEEQFGNPDLRVLALSLRDDILQIPYLDTAGNPLSEGDRIAMLRERLRDVRMLDANGYLTIPFSTKLAALSPVTRNHKVRHVEVDLAGVNMGDAVARVYLRMSGTGVVRSVTDDIGFHVFPTRLGVVNASLLGAKPFDPEVYRNYRFRDRPLVNTMWELVINQRDEQANQDLDLQTLTDLRVLFYYSDLTSF